MSLLARCVETYDAMMPGMSFRDGSDTILMAPVGHFVKNVDIEITLNGGGKFLAARRRVLKTGSKKDIRIDPKIIIPVTEKSLGRGSGADHYPHPLCDCLSFLFGDTESVAFQTYLCQLSDWNDWLGGDPKLSAIFAYLCDGTILDDLSAAGVIKLTADGFPENPKLSVCWSVEGIRGRSGPCWTDAILMSGWSKYYTHLIETDSSRKSGICMLTGETGVLTEDHAKGVFAIHGNAKLISFKGTVGNKFVYAGRFQDGVCPISISYEASQKAHNALAWLIANQGVTTDTDRAFLCWSPQGYQVPALNGFLAKSHDKGANVLPSNYKAELRAVLEDLKKDVRIPSHAGVVFVVLDAASKGRLSVLYYAEMPYCDYLDHLYAWEERCSVEGFSPSLWDIARFSSGVPRKGGFEVSKPAFRRTVERLLLCRTEGICFPADIAVCLTNIGSNLAVCGQGGKKPGKGIGVRERLLRTACAVIRKYRYDTKGEDWPMSLDLECMDRSYLYGRLLAVGETVERQAVRRKDPSAERETMALRMQRAFAMRPASTWRRVHENLEVYFSQLSVGSRNFYRELIAEIMSGLSAEDTDMPLEDAYLLGYYHQRKAFFAKKSIDSDNDNIDIDETEAEY